MTAQDIAERLFRMFKSVPGFTADEALEIVTDAMEEHGFAPSADVPTDKVRAIILYSQIQGAWQIAFSVAHYFSFSDGEESVDKSMISENYRKLAKDLQAEYDKETGKKFGNNFRIMSRLDRPITQPITGESAGARRWRRRY